MRTDYHNETRGLFEFKRSVYLDHHATTSVSKTVRRVMARVLEHSWGNPSSGYGAGKTSSHIIEKARRQVAGAMHAHPHEIWFTGSATEANNWVLKSLCDKLPDRRKNIISTPVEHPSVMNTLLFLQSRGISVQFCPVDKYGRVNVEIMEKLIDRATFLVCCMFANNETGTLQPVKEISAIARSRGALVMSDCVQAFGKVPVDVRDAGVDYATFSAHKLHGPKGIGALYSKAGSPLTPFIHGGLQEEGMRAGTEAIHNIAGFGEACKAVNELQAKHSRMRMLKELFISQIIKIQPEVIINSPENGCLPNTVSVTFPGIDSREFIMVLNYHEIAVSSGSACSSGQDKPSHVLKSIGLTDQEARETIRFSLGGDTNERDIRYTVKVIGQYMETCRRLLV